MKIKIEVEVDTENEQDVALIEKVANLVNELKEPVDYEDEE